MKVIEVKNLSKKYRLNKKESIRDFFRRKDLKESEFWALQDVSFSVEKGEKIGLIGRNGAGKSTLLKVLSAITHPTSGSFQIQGRIVSLLEVGTGFHPELTGRENIYLYGAILGMSKKEINKSFDAIVAFAEIERFLDLPVKRYSSGMYARLGFAVAIHVDPEILIVDEVISVGDFAFQQKCIQKLKSLESLGVTLLFVGHNLSQLTTICHRGILLDQGRLLFDGPVESCAKHYLDRDNKPSQNDDPIVIKNASIDETLNLEIEHLGGGSLTVEILSNQLPIAYTNLEDRFAGKKIPLGSLTLSLKLSTVLHPGVYQIVLRTSTCSLTLDYKQQGMSLNQGVSLDQFWSFQ